MLGATRVLRLSMTTKPPRRRPQECRSDNNPRNSKAVKHDSGKEPSSQSTNPATRRSQLSARRYGSFDVTVEGRHLSFLTQPGVFSHGGPDPGSLLLLENVLPEVKPHQTVLDLGCGVGLLGLALAGKLTRGEAWLVDSDIRAVRVAEENLRNNQIENAHVEPGDITLDLPRVLFDLVVSNPPTHSGKDVLSAFVTEARDVLRPGGWLYLVVNRLLSVREMMEAAFGNVDQVARQKGFIVFRSQKPRRHDFDP
jgi:16S rRNA (guanine1207-N2)-methyltransferase